MKEEISERIMRATHVDSSDVTVNVIGGMVILEGTVPDRYTKHYLEDLADGEPGVQDIENRVRVRRY
jgi:osmotically-inducible protein OsmY